MVEQLVTEIKIQSFCNHENIVKLFDCFEDEDHLYLLLELMSDGTLFDHLKKSKVLTEIQTS